MAVALALPVAVLFRVALEASAGRSPLVAVLLLLALSLGAALLWREVRSAWLRDAGPWWRVSLSEDRKGLHFEWQPQRWRDLSPWRNPTAWGEPLPLLGTLGGSVLILVYALAYRDPDVVMFAAIWPLMIGAFWLSLIGVIPPLFVPFQQKAKSWAVLSYEVVIYQPPYLSYQDPAGRGRSHTLVIGGTSFMRILTRGVRFAPDGVTIVGPRRFGLLPNHFIIPTRDPQIRARIRDWATAHRIPVHGNAAPDPLPAAPPAP